MQTVEASEQTPPPGNKYGPRLPNALKRLKAWLTKHHMTLMAINDTPHSIAFASAIGIFFGFTPLYSLKTLLSIAFAWVFRCNKLAAAIAVTLHDVLIFAMPAIYWAEYRLGYWTLHGRMPQRVRFAHFGIRDYMDWHLFVRIIWPAFVGSIIIGLPIAVAVYAIMRLLIRRSRAGEGTAV